jgi:glutathione reductase (NADPH)
MPRRSFDVVILGGGNAGMGVTVATREAGLTVAMIEPDLLGGTCPNRGCMPKKVLVAAAHALDEIERAKAHHITVGKPSLDWAALIDREKAIIGGIPASLGELMKRRGGRGDPRPRPFCRLERDRCRRRHPGGQAHRDRHRLEAAQAPHSRC